LVSDQELDTALLDYAPKDRTRRESRSAAGAITISWDDGEGACWDNLWPLLRDDYPEQRHTFAIYTDVIGTGTRLTATQIQTLHAAGHEIACHSKTHANIKDENAATRLVEYETSKTALETVVGEPVTTFVYPYGNLGRTTTTDKELLGRYDRVVNAGMSWAGVPLRDRRDIYLIPRPAVWNSSTHALVLQLIRRAARQPIILNLYAHRPGGLTEDMSVAELAEALDLIEELNIPVLNIRDAYPGGSWLVNPSAETGDLTGWATVESGASNTAAVVTDTPTENYAGTQAFRLVCGGDTDYIYLRQTIPCVEGDAVTFSGQTRAALTSGSGGCYLRLTFTDTYMTQAGSTYYSSAVTGATYAQSTVAATAPALTRHANLDMIILNKTATAYFDHLDVRLTRDGVLG
jgi:peptidoglycan/xylan/chitin deacetylase (PgdA/CDA1 family)